MQYWLMKSEPTAFSIDDLINSANHITHWEGVRNYQARNMMRDQMKPGDLAFFYHSNCEPPGIVGIVEIVKRAHADFTAFDPKSKYYDAKSAAEKPRWFMVDVRFKSKFKHMIPLQDLKQNPVLKAMTLLKRGNRLSITPVTQSEWLAIMEM